jgi:hypothetical protein
MEALLLRYASSLDPADLLALLRQLVCRVCPAATGATGATSFTRFVAVWTDLAAVPIGSAIPLTFSQNVLGAVHSALGIVTLTLAAPAPMASSTWGFGTNVSAPPAVNTLGGGIGLVHMSDTVKSLLLGPREMQTASVSTDGAGGATFSDSVDVASVAIVGNRIQVTLTGPGVIGDIVGADNSGNAVVWSEEPSGPTTIDLVPFDTTGAPLDPATTALSVSFLVVRQMVPTDLDGGFYLDTY